MSIGSLSYPSWLRAILAVFIILVLSVSCSGGGGGGGEGTAVESAETATGSSGDTAQQVETPEVTLAWDASTNPDVLGYKLYCGTESGDYPYVDDVGDATTWTISDVDVGVPYYCVVTAYSRDTESGFSNEVSFTRGG